MTLDDLRALADKFFVWPEGSGRQTVTAFSALLFAQHVLQLREKSLGAENSAGMDALRNAAQRQLDALGGYRREIGLLTGVPDEQPCDAEVALRAALEQQAEPAATFAENATTQQRVVETPSSDYRRGYWDGFNIGKREGRIEAADARAQQAEPEPVAWMCPEDPERETAFSWKAGHCENCGKQRIPLYTAPPQRKPLTDAEIVEAVRGADLDWQAGWTLDEHEPNRFTTLARAIEHAHGIGEEE